MAVEEGKVGGAWHGWTVVRGEGLREGGDRARREGKVIGVGGWARVEGGTGTGIEGGWGQGTGRGGPGRGMGGQRGGGAGCGGGGGWTKGGGGKGSVGTGGMDVTEEEKEVGECVCVEGGGQATVVSYSHEKQIQQRQFLVLFIHFNIQTIKERI